MIATALMIPAAAASARSAAPDASPSGRDVRSARKLIAAESGYYEAGLRTRLRARAGINATIALLKGLCPNVIPAEAVDASRRHQKVARRVFFEVNANLELAESAPLVPAGLHEAATLDRLRFRSARATRDARELARSRRLIAAVRPSDVCSDLRAAAADHYNHVPSGTRRFLSRFVAALSSPTPLFAELEKDLQLVSRRDRAAFARMRSLNDAYFSFAGGVLFEAEPKLVSVLEGTRVSLKDQAGTTTAASTRSTSSSNEIPAASAASGRRLVSVSPGMGLTSSTNSSLVELSSIRSTRAKPAQPSSPYVSSAISPARVATVSSIWAGQTKRVRPIS